MYLKRLNARLKSDDNNQQLIKQQKEIEAVLLKAQIKNRRYKKLQQLIAEGDYFSYANMQERQPTLFYQYIGQYTGEEITQKGMKLSERLLHIHDIATQQNYYEEQTKLDQEEMIENDEVEDEDENEDENENEDEEQESDDNRETKNNTSTATIEKVSVKKVKVVQESEQGNGSTAATMGEEMDIEEQEETTELEKEELENEFLRIMKEKFLSGEDGEFVNYKEVDENEELDDYKQIETDAQDRYFDEIDEEPSLEKNLGHMNINSQTMQALCPQNPV